MIDVEFSYTKLSPSRDLAVASNRTVASISISGDGFTVKESEYVFDTAPSEMDNQADTRVFGINFRFYFTTSKRCTLSPLLLSNPSNSICL